MDPRTATDDELTTWLRRVGAEQRRVDAVMAELAGRGYKPAQIAAWYGVNRSTVGRRIARSRAG